MPLPVPIAGAAVTATTVAIATTVAAAAGDATGATVATRVAAAAGLADALCRRLDISRS